MAATSIIIDLPDMPRLTPHLFRYDCNDRPAILLYEADEEDELWCDLTVNLPEHQLPSNEYAFVPAENKPYIEDLERQRLLEIGPTVGYGNFNNRAYIVRLSPYLIDTMAN